ncbi:MAG: purine-binding chemotaxis protein CheW [Magnetococcales bacterium]|nr:purine-binding chemotaxis protein CheW [Magnetococcales bacterium]
MGKGLTALPTLVFRLEEQLFGMPLHQVERVLRAVEITSLPDAPEKILGFVNDHGRQLPVMDIRRRLSLPPSPIHPDQRIIIALGRRPFCFFVDTVNGVVDFRQEEFRSPEEIYPGMEHFLSAIFTWSGDTVLVFDCDLLFASSHADTVWQEMHHPART